MNSMNKKEGSEYCEICTYFTKYIFVFILLFISLCAVLFFNLLITAKSYAYYVNSQMSYNIYEYNEVDLEQLCRISMCKYVMTINDIENDKIKTLYKGEYRGKELIISVDETSTTPELKKLFLNYFYDEEYNIVLFNDKAQAYFSLNLDKFKEELKFSYSLTFLIVYLIVSLILYFSYRNQRREQLLQTYGTEAILANQSMILITENVHHELNTPLEVIDNKLEKIKRTIQDYVLGEYKEFESAPMAVLTSERIKINQRMIRLNKDFEFVETSLEQVFGVLERMRGFKHLKYSNGDKNLYDIIEGACQVISIRDNSFKFDIDNALKDYKLTHKSQKDLKNVDLLNIIINHLKNSLEAKSSYIRILLEQNEEKNQNVQKIGVLIIDNGNGIPQNFIPEVFKPNFSTKSSVETVRGNGMYLNKYILNSAGGDVSIIDSDSNGTAIKIVIPCLYQEHQESFL